VIGKSAALVRQDEMREERVAQGRALAARKL
jgi:hypothetical protein